MNLCIISGSHRSNGSYKTADFIGSRLAAKGISFSRINLSEESIPLRDESRRDKDSETTKRLAPIREKLIQADGFIIISPERSGMAAPGLKNFFLLASSKHEFAHKPAMLVGVSSGTGGSYPIAELRMSSYKNTKLCYIPDHVIVRDVDNSLNDHEMNEEFPDIRIKKRIDRTLDILQIYTKAFIDIRESAGDMLFEHEYGM